MAIPRFLKHVTLAVMNSGSVKGGGRAGFKESFTIARAQLAKHGYLTGAVGPIDSIILTYKGHTREALHRKEGLRGWVKDRKFDAMMAFLRFKPGELETPTSQDATGGGPPSPQQSGADTGTPNVGKT